MDAAAFREMIRFNEAVDQMVAESVREFSSITERIRDLFTGVLAHDLRSPVGAILNSTRVIMADANLSAIVWVPYAASSSPIAATQRWTTRHCYSPCLD